MWIVRFVLLSAVLAFTPAYGAETPWVEIGPDARIRLISSDVRIDGVTHAAIEIDMPQSTKTYWRIPGETGIPLRLDISQSQSIADAQIQWPYPTRESAGGYLDFVYHGHTVLPIVLQVGGDSARFDADLMLGICDDICVPVQYHTAIDMKFDKPDAAQQLRINQALAEVPLIWEQDSQPIGAITYENGKNRLAIPFIPGLFDPASLIVDTGNAAELFSLPQKSPDGDILYFEMLGEGDDLGLRAAPITLTFLTEDGAFVLSKTVAQASPAR